MYVGDVYEDDVYLVIPSGGGGVLLNGKKQKARPEGRNLKGWIGKGEEG